MKFYISFGQTHAHSIAGKTFDKDCIAVIEAKGAKEAMDLVRSEFGLRWSRFFTEEDPPKMVYFPRGFIEL